ncbi:endonuclease MutS2 [Vulgatibacter incomptus]|uniref:Endonuclease MutS2 n=1 Tax=Vulgatibacter incomptus TaxID=1391653 RepID=A0A0K1PE08_9BACT|nr:Smr/MutS family protein [Vulgatibacter incomptus]AKU91727.1 Recombination inhibitory protein MutS2 [Vulgatibacter incomptus]
MFAIPERTLRDLGWRQLTTALAERTSTPRGRALAQALPFLSRKDEIERSLSRIAEARLLLRKELSLPVGGAEDVRDLLSFAAKGATLEAAQLVACARLIRAASRTRTFLHAQRLEAPALAAESQALADASSLASRIETSFEPSGRLKDSASAMLGSLRDRARGLHHEIKGRLDELMADRDFSATLRDEYLSIRNDRYVVPVNASFRSKVPGIVHNASNSGQTLFIEPQTIVGLGNDLSIAESMAAEEERRVLQELSSDLGERSGELIEAVELLAKLDLAEAAGRLADDLDASAPRLTEGRGRISLRAVRHPLLVLQGKKVVANDLSLAQGERALVVSGPNAGGKTVTITAVGLCALLVRAGMPIPAEADSEVPLFSTVSSAIGDEQDLARDLSTFSAHLTTLKEILARAGEGALVLIDEIAADTDPREGAAIASAVLGDLVEKGARVLVTTHLEELKALGLADSRFANARVGLDPRTLTPTFKLELGAAGLSSALEIAARVGLPAAVLDVARTRLHGGSALAVALEQLEAERREAHGERTRLEAERREVATLRAEVQAARVEADAARREAEARVRDELRAELEAARREVGELLARLTARPAVSEAVQAQKSLQDKAAEQERASARARAHVQAMREEKQVLPAQAIRPGARVRVASLGRDAEVVELGRDHALVAVGPLKTRVKLDDLLPLAGKAPSPTAGRPPGGGKTTRAGRAEALAAGAIAGPEARCDIRGLRADEAVREIELFLDRAYSEGPAVVSILHGHGTGALKKTVREALAASPYVADSRPGDRHEGGDAVTIVELRS